MKRILGARFDVFLANMDIFNILDIRFFDLRRIFRIRSEIDSKYSENLA